MKILVTGGLGYTGIELVKKLLSLGHTIVVVDINLYSNVTFFDNFDNIEIIVADIREIDWEILNQKRIEAVYHLAGVSNDPGNGVSSEVGYSINFEETKRLYSYLKYTQVKHFIYPSSCSVYGSKNIDIVDENSLLDPQNDYAKSKAMVENYILKNFNRNVSTTIVRPATVYGYSERQRLDLINNKIIVGACLGKVITLPNMHNIRPSVYIKNLINIYVHVLELNHKFEIYNIAFDNFTISETVERIVKALNSDCKIDYNEWIDQRSYKVDMSKIQSVMSIKFYDFEDSIRETIQDFKTYKIIENFSDKKYYNALMQSKFWGKLDDE
ncbi:NAD-dependent epimerase/dehydratase family protein [Streptococcus dysgalactiae]|uniref:NAD-dependent epimerase/dehydratase family protein n=1 Tax=Streptococcus dysgalactiae TaxID=1334 RepID=UPI002DD448FB|nr:NAD(P)-dependent oxidoreductase [Streptococcus dysgalactiae]MEC4578554.1 NAD(P)-dependent oxidoreductase [Streptococcus dysgalactiae]